MAGGWDEKVSENVEYLEELKRLADKSFVKKAVLFMPSISDKVRVVGGSGVRLPPPPPLRGMGGSRPEPLLELKAKPGRGRAAELEGLVEGGGGIIRHVEVWGLRWLCGIAFTESPRVCPLCMPTIGGDGGGGWVYNCNEWVGAGGCLSGYGPRNLV